MSAEAPGGSRLEDIMFRLINYQSNESVDQIDTMIMLSLVNLMGILSVMNKQPLGGATAGPLEDPAISSLLGMLSQGQNPQMSRGGAPGINPALLLSLLGPQGQRPENALLLGLLSSMMQQPPPPLPPTRQTSEKKERPPELHRQDQSEKAPEIDSGRLRRQGNPLSWNGRLG